MAQLFRGKMLCALRRAHRRRELRLPDELTLPSRLDALVDTLLHTDWIVYAKPPFGGAQNVYAYLGRYTHRVGLSNYRLRGIDDEHVTFVGRHDKLVTLTHHEFIRRFLQHILPKDFVRLRHYGLLAPAMPPPCSRSPGATSMNPRLRPSMTSPGENASCASPVSTCGSAPAAATTRSSASLASSPTGLGSNPSSCSTPHDRP